jgi:hypothetical protein
VVDGPGRKSRSRWLVAAAALLAVILALAVAALIVAFTWFDVSLGDGVGGRTYAPRSANGVRHTYKLGVGSLKLDLSRVTVDKEVHVEARVGLGSLRVIVPGGPSVAVDARTKAGSVTVFGRHADGRNARIRTDGDRLFLVARVGAGGIDVIRGG